MIAEVGLKIPGGYVAPCPPDKEELMDRRLVDLA